MSGETFTKCGQKDCQNIGAHRYTWPGRDESVICDGCLPKLQAVAEAMGMFLQIRPLD